MKTPNNKIAARRDSDGKAGEAYRKTLAHQSSSDKLILECGDDSYVVYCGRDGIPKIDPIDETTRWRISRRADGEFDVEIIIDELEGARS